MKKILVLLVALIFSLGVVGLAFAAEVKGTVTKIDGKKITVKDAAGKETTVEAKEVKDVKAGDMVTIKDGMVTKEVKKKKAIEGC